MARYVVREKVTLIHFVDAASEAEALAKVYRMGFGEFDDIDYGPDVRDDEIEIELAAD